ncbi:MAG: hypothetical protein PWQ70_2193 [Clostridiales bacterium]|nr:hypothetical protein [Clostridiales bacterium]
MPNNKQFNKEMSKIRDEMDKIAAKKSKTLLRGYKRNLDDIRTEIAKIYAKYTKNNELSISKRQRLQILKQLEKKLVKMTNKLGDLEEKITTDILKDVAKESGLRTIYTIEKGINTIIDFAFLNEKLINKVLNTKIDGKKFSDRIWDNKKKLVKRLRNDIDKALIQGKSVEKLARDIKKDFGVSAYESKRLINTEVSHVQSRIQEEVYQESDVVQKITWIATLDEKTRDEHRDFDGKVWDKNEEHPSPEDFVNCRCTLAPIIESWKPTKRRENIKTNGEKQVIEYKSYNDWKKSRDI